MKKTIMIGLGITVLLLGAAITKDQVIKLALTKGVSKIIGARVTIDRLRFRVFDQSIRIKRLKVFNPEGFSKEVMIDIPLLYIDWNLGAFFQKEFHIKKMILNLRQAVITKNEEKSLNLQSLKVMPSASKEENPPEEKDPDRSIIIDSLELSIGQIIYRDYTTGKPPPKIRLVDIGLKNKEFKNLPSPRQLITTVLTELTKQSAIKGLKLYGTAAVLGAGVLPVGAAKVLVAKDYVEERYSIRFKKAYEVTLAALFQLGKVTQDNRDVGEIRAVVNGHRVVVTIVDHGKASIIRVAARKKLIPSAKYARTLLYQISRQFS